MRTISIMRTWQLSIGVGLFLLVGCFFIILVLQLLVCSVGFCGPRTYLLLFQNNYELRPTGGFLGSYGVIKVEKGKVVELRIQDIYVPDGQIQGHVEPPWPIQAAFGQGWYRIRDSNFDPDFPRAVETMRWFFEKGGEEKADGVIAINLFVFGRILTTLGPLYIPDEAQPLTAENFYHRMQSEVELDFFPGSQQKQVYVSKVGRALLRRLHETTTKEKVRLFVSGLQLLRQKQIFIYVDDNLVQTFIRKLGWDGSLINRRTSRLNTFSLFEANLGANKGNCCIEREVNLSIQPKERSLQHTATIVFENRNPSSLKNPPYSFGGAYVNYIRIYLPKEARITTINIGPHQKYPAEAKEETTQEPISIGGPNWKEKLATHSALHRVDIQEVADKGLVSVGFFVVVDALGDETVRLTYDIPRSAIRIPGKIYIQKQAGVEYIPLRVGSRVYTIRSDMLLSLPF